MEATQQLSADNDAVGRDLIEAIDAATERLEQDKAKLANVRAFIANLMAAQSRAGIKSKELFKACGDFERQWRESFVADSKAPAAAKYEAIKTEIGLLGVTTAWCAESIHFAEIEALRAEAAVEYSESRVLNCKAALAEKCTLDALNSVREKIGMGAQFLIENHESARLLRLSDSRVQKAASLLKQAEYKEKGRA